MPKFESPIFLSKTKKKVGVMISQETKIFKRGRCNFSNWQEKNLKEISRNLFKTLREFDKKKAGLILAETFPEKDIGFATMHRLQKAATFGRN